MERNGGRRDECAGGDAAVSDIGTGGARIVDGMLVNGIEAEVPLSKRIR
jgi:hypothetical protein